MADNDMSHRIRDGLPLCISCDTDDGFNKLKEKLGINRDRLKTLIEVAKKHIKSVRDAGLSNRLKSRERNRILLSTLYRNKVHRYAVWEVTFSRLKNRQNFSQDVPSLEHRLLSKYVEAYDFSSTDTARCAEVFAEWPDLVQKLSAGIPWADFAAFAWDDIRNHLEANRWASLDANERTDVALAAFLSL